MKKLLFISLCVAAQYAQAQLSPVITSWKINPDTNVYRTTVTTTTGTTTIPSNVLKVQYSTSDVYVSCTCIPGYSIGPWTGNPNHASNQNFVFKITQNPQRATGTATNIGLGHIGVWTNGVSIFNVSDAQSYNNAGVWNRNAYYWEGNGFDQCLGHPQQQGEYHHHVSPTCLYDDKDSLHHSPIIGFAFDGFPVYGAYAYSDTNGTGSIKRMRSSYTTTTVSTRTNGPAVSTQYPVGCFIEDFTYVSGSGDLDQRNGRWCKTPEYPNGTYAYFVTIDEHQTPVFPYTFYGSYYGTVQAGNLGQGPGNSGGHNTISVPTTVYTGTTGINDLKNNVEFEIVPNPTSGYVYVYMGNNSPANATGKLYDMKGALLQTIDYMQPTIAYTIDMTKYPAGMYVLNIESGSQKVSRKIVRE